MTEVVFPVRVTGGVTQVAPETADSGRIKDSLNMVPVPEIGLARRGPTEHLTELNDREAALALLPVDLGGEDRYLLSLAHDSVKAFRRNGDELDVFAVTRDADGNITGGTAPDFSYLDFRTPNQYTPDDVAEALATWTKVGSASTPILGLGNDVPLGWPENSTKAYQDKYTILNVSSTADASGRSSSTGICIRRSGRTRPT